MTKAELEALAERVEREEPSDDINELVRVAVGASRIKNSAGDMDPPAYTTSLDAAVTLVGNRPWAIRYTDGATAWAWVLGKAGNNKTPAAALTAAALRARTQEARND